jgi:hypothetical protein
MNQILFENSLEFRNNIKIYIYIYIYMSEDCKCDGDINKFYDLIEGVCIPKANGVIDETEFLGVYGKATDGQCVNVCQILENMPGYLTKASEELALQKCNIASFEELPNDLKNILKTFKYLILNINEPNDYTYKLLNEINKPNYKRILLDIPRENIKDLGKAKILPQCTLNPDLANIVNIYSLTLNYYLQIIEIDDPNLRIKIDSNKIHIKNAMFDFGCSMGEINTFYQHILLDEKLILSVGNVIGLIINAINQTIVNINGNRDVYMGLGIPIRDINNQYNETYEIHYLIRLLNNCKENIINIIPTFNMSIIHPTIIQKFNQLEQEINTRFGPQNGGSNYKQKYLKYKQKYLKYKQKYLELKKFM